MANNPEMFLNYRYAYSNDWSVGQLTATGEGTLSAGQMTINALLGSRGNSFTSYSAYSTLCPTLINYADKMRADNVKINMLYNNRNYTGDGEWHFISLPFDVKVSDIVPADNTYWVIRRYDSAARATGEADATWVNLTDEDTMEAGKGYIVSAAYGGTGSSYPMLSFTSGNSLTKNNLFRSKDVIVPLEEYPAEFAHNRSWNLIGNPYPCYFDMHYLNEEFTAPVTIWNGVNYVAYSPVDDNLVLAPYEAFFVQCPLNATEMTFKEAGRLHSDDGMSQYKMPEKTVADVSAEGRNVFNFELTGEKSSDRARIVLNPEAEAGYEIGRDASKFFADKSDFAQLYVAGDVEYSICERPVGEGAATLGIRGAEEATYTLSLSGRYSSEWHVIVTDKMTGASVDLTEQDYQFVSGKGDTGNRFFVRFQLGSQSEVNSVLEEFGSDAEVTVTAVNGAVAYKGRLSEMNVPSAGIYVISNGEVSLKAILK